MYIMAEIYLWKERNLHEVNIVSFHPLIHEILVVYSMLINDSHIIISNFNETKNRVTITPIRKSWKVSDLKT